MAGTVMAKIKSRRGNPREVSQVSVEFIALVSFVLLLTIGILALLAGRIHDITKSNEEKLVENFRDIIFNELNLANQGMDGYTRHFNLPVELADINYIMQIENNTMLVINYSDKDYIYKMPYNAVGRFDIDFAREYDYYIIQIKKENNTVIIQSLNNTYYYDFDGDGYGNTLISKTADIAPEDFVLTAGDCDDTNEDINPGVDEVCFNGVDDDCDDKVDICDTFCCDDIDGDGYTSDMCCIPADPSCPCQASWEYLR